jgi:membrane associated rhomboid family serine protease
MTPQDEPLVEVFRGSQRAAQERAVVLSALAIPHHTLRVGTQTHLLTTNSHAPRALDELAQYEAEPPLRSPRLPKGDRDAALQGAGIFALTIATFHALAQAHTLGHDWRAAGASHAAAVLSGDWWRPITALTLHADLPHLLSNLLFGGLFTALLSAEIKPARALSLTLLSGALGNLLNALLADPSHASLGASTAVFGALGLLVATRLSTSTAGTSAARAWIPLLAGLALLGWLGGPSERPGPHGPIQTDVAAHVLGLLSGLLLGILPTHRLRPLPLALATLTLLLLAWTVALQ